MLYQETIYLYKARERLAGAESEFANDRFHNCARGTVSLADTRRQVADDATDVITEAQAERILRRTRTFVQATVDLDDTDVVLDLVIERMMAFRLEQGFWQHLCIHEWRGVVR